MLALPTVRLAYDYGAVHRLCLDRRGRVRRDNSRRVGVFFEDLWRLPRGSAVVLPTRDSADIEGVLEARRLFPDAVTYSTDATPIPEIAKTLRVRHRIVDSTPSGEMLIDDLENSIDVRRPAIVCAAADDCDAIRDVLTRHHMTGRSHVHVSKRGFELPFIVGGGGRWDSIAVDACESLNVPVPCSVYGSKTRKTPTDVAAYAAAFLRYAIDVQGYDGFERDIVRCLERADDLVDAAAAVGVPAKRRFMTVTFGRSLPKGVAERWKLAPGPSMVVGSWLTPEVIEAFVREIKPERNA